MNIFIGDAPPDINEDIGFVCPKCGGHYWGTSNCSDSTSPTPIGHCHDQYGIRCRFTWPRSDDFKYFKPR